MFLTSGPVLYVCIMYVSSSHIARVRVKHARLPILLVISSTTGKMFFSLYPFAPENLVSRDGFGSSVPRQPAHLHTRAESGAYVRDSSRVPRRRPLIYLKPPYAIGSVPSLSGHAIAYRWRSLPRVHRHRASIYRRYFQHAHFMWMWEREAYINWSMVTCQGSTRSELP